MEGGGARGGVVLAHRLRRPGVRDHRHRGGRLVPDAGVRPADGRPALDDRGVQAEADPQGTAELLRDPHAGDRRGAGLRGLRGGRGRSLLLRRPGPLDEHRAPLLQPARPRGLADPGGLSRPPAARRQLGRRGQDARVAEAVGPVVPPRPRRADGADGVPGEARPLPHRPRDAGGGDGGRPQAGGEPGRRRRAGLRARHRPPALDGAERGRGRRAVRRAGRRPRGHRLRLRRPRPPRLPPRRQRRRDRHPPRLGAEEGGADDQLTRRGCRPRLRGE